MKTDPPEPTYQTARLTLRSADLADREKIFNWRNDPWILSFSNSQRTVSLDEHREWFENALNDPTHSIDMIRLDDKEIGVIRLNRTGADQATISIYLLREFCGKGYGTTAIRLACEKGWSLWPISHIDAFTRKTNLASERSFQKNGFLLVDASEDLAENHLLHLRKTR
jgi:RimJ/RimL family protein N-acetyltransferase